MLNVKTIVSTENNFFGDTDPIKLAKEFGTPLYVYNENILRQRCRDLKNLVNYKNFRVNYSPKANSNLELLKIIKSEGLLADAMSPGEIYINMKAGFKPEEIQYIGNNVSTEEMKYAVDAGVNVSVDSVCQLERYGMLNPGSKVTIRINPGTGAGHHKNVVTAGKNTKFGIEIKYLPDVKDTAEKYNLKITGINQHIGSLFMDGKSYITSAEVILSLAKDFPDLVFIDLGGGFGIPYKKSENQERLDLKDFGDRLAKMITDWVKEYGREITLKIEPGRYIVAECGILLGQVFSTKLNYDTKYIGTDLGFNVNIRPVMYGAHHDVEIYREKDVPSEKEEVVTIVGNICETGDYMAKDRLLPEIMVNDIIGVLDSGAYCYSMCSNYNNRLRPAEVLIESGGNYRLIRRRDILEDLMGNY